MRRLIAYRLQQRREQQRVPFRWKWVHIHVAAAQAAEAACCLPAGPRFCPTHRKPGRFLEFFIGHQKNPGDNVSQLLWPLLELIEVRSCLGQLKLQEFVVQFHIIQLILKSKLPKTVPIYFLVFHICSQMVINPLEKGVYFFLTH